MLRPITWIAFACLLAAPVAKAEDTALDLDGVRAALRGQTERPVKCATPVFLEAIEAGRGQEVAEMTAAKEISALLYQTPEGHFEIDYEIDGSNAVPLDDGNLNGVPDYVEWTGETMEESWAREITQAGFPALDLESGRYLVRLRAIGGIYGWCTQSSLYPGGSSITMNADFPGFYQTYPFLIGEDPDGKVRGALRVTAAHEFKHAIQFAQGGWESPGTGLLWVELDATWMEDVVYDQVNDYYNYIIGGGSPFTNPEISLIDASYEDSTWQHYLMERHGEQLVVDFAALRAAQPTLSCQAAYRLAAENAGLDWVEVWREYAVWNYLTGARVEASIGFGEADRYPTSSLLAVPTALPYTRGATALRVLANHFYSVDLSSLSAVGAPTIDFSGDPGVEWTLSLVLQGSGAPAVIDVPVVDGAADFTALTNIGLYDTLGVVVGNGRVGATSSLTNVYQFTLDFDESIAVERRSVSSFKGAFRPR